MTTDVWLVTMTKTVHMQSLSMGGAQAPKPRIHCNSVIINWLYSHQIFRQQTHRRPLCPSSNGSTAPAAKKSKPSQAPNFTNTTASQVPHEGTVTMPKYKYFPSVNSRHVLTCPHSSVGILLSTA